MIKWSIIVASLLFVAVASLCDPEFLAQNKFLREFVSHELLSLLAVVMTITFASVVNIHLALNQVIARVYAADISHGQKIAGPARSETASNAWLLFWAFVACVTILMIKGATPPEELHVLSLLNGLALCILVVNILVFYDIYDTIFTLASSDVVVKASKPKALDNG